MSLVGQCRGIKGDLLVARTRGEEAASLIVSGPTLHPTTCSRNKPLPSIINLQNGDRSGGKKINFLEIEIHVRQVWREREGGRYLSFRLLVNLPMQPYL